MRICNVSTVHVSAADLAQTDIKKGHPSRVKTIFLRRIVLHPAISSDVIAHFEPLYSVTTIMPRDYQNNAREQLPQASALQFHDFPHVNESNIDPAYGTVSLLDIEDETKKLR